MEKTIKISEYEYKHISNYLEKRLLYFERKGENFLMDNRWEYEQLVTLSRIFPRIQDEQDEDEDDEDE